MTYKFNSGILAGAVALCYVIFPIADAKHGKAGVLAPLQGAISNNVSLPLPQDLIVDEDQDQAWKQALEQIKNGLPADLKPPRAFADLAAKGHTTCESEEMVSFGDRNVACWLVETIIQAADETDTDPVYLMALADKESSFRVNAKASTSTAVGLFQFLNATWLELVRDYGARHNLEAEAAAITTSGGKLTIEDKDVYARVMQLRENPYVAAVMAGEMLKRDATRIGQRLGRDLDRSEYYFAHFLGAGSASRLLQANAVKPRSNASGLFPQAARANRSLFTSGNGRKKRSVTVGEFHQRIENMMGQRMERYEEMKNIVVAQADYTPR